MAVVFIRTASLLRTRLDVACMAARALPSLRRVPFPIFFFFPIFPFFFIFAIFPFSAELSGKYS
jgi:hypothetical protein